MNTATDNHDEEIDLVELGKIVWRRRKTVIKWGVIGLLVGTVVAFSIPREFTTTVKMAPEEAGRNNQAAGMSGLAALAGINIGSSSMDGINLNLYPDVVKSTPFLIELCQMPVREQKSDETETLYQYTKNLSKPWWQSLMALPMKAVGGVISLFKPKEEQKDALDFDPFMLTAEQQRVLEALSHRIAVAIDKKTGVITASATLQDPFISAVVTDSLVNKLQEYVAQYRTEKAKRDLEFTHKMFLDAQQAYQEKQRQYAAYMDVTQNVVRQAVIAEQERLRNEQLLAYNVYSQMTQQLELAKMKVQEDTPSVTIIEPATVPTRKSNMSKPVIMLVFAFIAAIISIGILIIPEIFPTLQKNRAESTEE